MRYVVALSLLVCLAYTTAARASVECSDGIDNDGDGKIDYADVDCNITSGVTEFPAEIDQGAQVHDLGTADLLVRDLRSSNFDTGGGLTEVDGGSSGTMGTPIESEQRPITSGCEDGGALGTGASAGELVIFVGALAVAAYVLGRRRA